MSSIKNDSQNPISDQSSEPQDPVIANPKFRDFFRFTKTDGIGLLITIIVLALGGLSFSLLDKEYARIWDKEWGFWYIFITSILALAGLIWNFAELKKQFLNHLPSKKSTIALMAVIALAGGFVFSQINMQHRVLSDESSWESMALQMVNHQRGGVCNQGIFLANGSLDCMDEVNNFKGKTTSIAYYYLFQIFEPTRDTALQLNFWLYLFSLIFLFYGLFLAMKDEWLALATSTFLAAFPIYMFQARSASTEVMHIFLLSALFVIHQILCKHETKWKHFLLILPIMGLYAQTRQETLFSFLPFAFYFFAFFRKKVWHLPAYTAAAIAVCWPIINTMAAYKGYDFQGGEHDAHSLENFFYNIKTNIDIMLNLEPETDGMMKYPWNTTTTVLLLAGSAWLLIRSLFQNRYRWGILLALAFHLQSLVILVNVSGTFKIDINQRYVLIALPGFALTLALFLKDIFSLGEKKNPFSKKASIISFSLALALGIGLSILNLKDFHANTMYHKNKLLGEEEYLHNYLKEFPKNSIFIYSRPWQMLCSGYNGFSEKRLLGMSEQEFQKWIDFSGGHIYLVRGQDGYGTVNTKSRVVGFKTTTTIEQILKKFNSPRIHTNSKDFGYPLSIHHIQSFNGGNKWRSRWFVNLSKEKLTESETLTINLRKTMNEAIEFNFSIDDSIWIDQKLSQKDTSLQVPAILLSGGIHTLKVQAIMPDSTVLHQQNFVFVESNGARLLSDFPIESYTQGWGSPQMNKSVEKNSLQVDSLGFPFGIGAHAPSKLKINLKGQFKEFHSIVGLDKESACGDGASFAVWGNGKVLAKSKHVHSLELDTLKVNISQVEILELETINGTTNFCDHTDWLLTWIK